MIISDNPHPQLSEFEQLMKATDFHLNLAATNNNDYFTKRTGKLLEEDVYAAVTECSKGTAFEGSITLVSGASFPDIIAANYYGIEVKSTIKNHWKSIGSSILESTRITNIERIYLTFGKLGNPVEFRSKPYEDCLYDIAVTHYPRYQIDMNLSKGETIFDKMGIPYDELRKLDNPVEPVSNYYQKKLKPGERLWWSNNSTDSAVPPTIKLWTSLLQEEKEELTILGYILFPEILSNSSKKYSNYALWMATEMGVVNTNIRDSFSAGGKKPQKNSGGIEILLPAAYERIRKYNNVIAYLIYNMNENTLEKYWKAPIQKNRIDQWIKLISSYSSDKVSYSISYDVLSTMFSHLSTPTKYNKLHDKGHNSFFKIAENYSDYNL